MTEDNADRQRAAGWPDQPFPGPPPSPYPSGPPARPSTSGPPPEARRSVSSSASDRPAASPSFTYSPPTAKQISHDPGAFASGPGSQPPAPPSASLPTAPLPGGPAPAPAPPPSFGGPASPSAGPTRPSDSPFSAPPRQSTVPGQAAASEVHQTIRLPQPEPTQRPDAPAPWTARSTDPFPQPGFPDGIDGEHAPVLPPAKNGPGAGARVLGSVVGLLLGLLGFVGILVGQYSSEGNQTRGLWFGVGLVLLVVAVLLGSWTAATPITAGVVGAVPGLFGVIAPVTWNDTVDKLSEIDLGFDLAGLTANDAIWALGSYPAAAAGVLLVAAGIATVLGRRRGAARQF